MAEELKRLKRENERLKRENEILLKASAFFASRQLQALRRRRPSSNSWQGIWAGVTIDEFMGMLDAYLRWYRDIRIKSDLDYRSPMQYRRDLGLAA